MNMPVPPSTSTPASEVSSADFARDDSANSAELEAKSLGDILRNSPAAAMLGLDKEESLPQEDDAAPTTDDAEETDPEAEAESENDEGEDNQDSEEDNEVVEDDEDSTQDTAELPTEDEIDWDYKVPVTVNGKVEYKSLSEIRKGYSTDQHLSNEGRKLGELRKQVEQERDEKLKEIVTIGSVLHQEISAQEATLAESYHAITKKLEDARETGDTYSARELKEEREAIQEKYWTLRKSREEKISQVTEQFQKQQEERQSKLIKEFSEQIPQFIPDFNDKVATSIREFALKEGIPEALLGEIYSPAVVKFINDYRTLKQAADKGSSKRKVAPTSKSVPTKKGVNADSRTKQADQNLRAKALSGQAGKQEGLDFLKSISKVSKKF
jgi:hypothetical protein